jgi:hypothetical protein
MGAPMPFHILAGALGLVVWLLLKAWMNGDGTSSPRHR